MAPRVERLGVLGSRVEAGVLDGFLQQGPEHGLFLVASSARRRVLRARLLGEIEAGRSVPVYTLRSLPQLLGPEGTRVPLLHGLARLALIEELLRDGALGGSARDPGPGLLREALRLVDEVRGARLDRREFEEAPPEEIARSLALTARYQERLEALGVEDSLARAARLVEVLRALPARKGAGDWSGGYLAVERPSDWSPLERDAVEELARLARRIEVLVPEPAGAEVAFQRARGVVDGLFPGSPHRSLPPVEPPGPLLTHLFRRIEEPQEAEELFLLECATAEEEVHAAARWIRELERTGRISSLREVALVLPSSTPYLELVDELFPEHRVPFHDDLPRPLEETRVAATLMNLMEAAGHGWPRRALVELARSPLVDAAAVAGPGLDPELLDQAGRLAGVASGREEWMRGVRDLALRYRQDPEEEEEEDAAARLGRLAFAERLEALGDSLERLFAVLAPLEEARHSHDLRRRCEDVLAALRLLPRLLETGGERWARREAGALRAFLGLLDELPGAEAARGHALDAAGAEQLLRASLRAARYRPPSATPAGVQVLLPNDAAAGEWTAMAVLGMKEGAFPAPGGRPPVFGGSRRLRKALEALPRYAEEEREALYLLLSSLHGPLLVTRPREERGVRQLPAHYLEVMTRTATFRAPELPEGWTSGARALQERLAEGLLAPASAGGELPPEGAESVAVIRAVPELGEVARRVRVNRLRTLPRGERYAGVIEDPRLRALLAGMHPPDKEISITTLEELAQCPFRFFASRVLGLGEREELAEEVDARTRGSLVHRILQRFMEEWTVDHPRVTPEDLDEARALLHRIGERAFGSAETSGYYWDREKERLLGGARAPGVLERWLELEATRDADAEVALLEWEFGEGAGRPVTIGAGEDEDSGVRVRGRVDRIDRLRDGSGFVVWDYKTGSVHEPIPKLQAMIRLQLPLYLVAAARHGDRLGEPLGAAYLQVGNVKKVEASGQFGDGPRIDHRGEYPLFRAGQSKPQTKSGWKLGQEGEPPFGEWMQRVVRRVGELGARLRSGRFFAFRHPEEHDCVLRCPYRDICRVEESEAFRDPSAELLPDDEEAAT